jgi:hypothetical protein
MTVTIVNDGGVFLVNGKRLGHDSLTQLEMAMLNEFIKEFKNQ